MLSLSFSHKFSSQCFTTTEHVHTPWQLCSYYPAHVHPLACVAAKPHQTVSQPQSTFTHLGNFAHNTQRTCTPSHALLQSLIKLFHNHRARSHTLATLLVLPSARAPPRMRCCKASSNCFTTTFTHLGHFAHNTQRTCTPLRAPLQSLRGDHHGRP